MLEGMNKLLAYSKVNQLKIKWRFTCQSASKYICLSTNKRKIFWKKESILWDWGIISNSFAATFLSPIYKPLKYWMEEEVKNESSTQRWTCRSHHSMFALIISSFGNVYENGRVIEKVVGRMKLCFKLYVQGMYSILLVTLELG